MALAAAATVALLAEGVDRNMYVYVPRFISRQSPSSQRAWIEIYSHKHSEQHKGVALLAEGVDRNVVSSLSLVFSRVALLAEGVDRNKMWLITSKQYRRRPPRRGRG